MKKFIFIQIVIIAILNSCKLENSVDYAILSGTIINPNSDSLVVSGESYKHTIHLNENNSFSDTLRLEKGYYKINDGKKSSNLFLKPGFDLSLSVDAYKFGHSITFKGLGEAENNYLAKKTLNQHSFGNILYYRNYQYLDEQRFLTILDSLYSLELGLLKKSSNVKEDFYFLEENKLNFTKLKRIADFETLKRFVTGNKEYKVSSTYPNPFVGLDTENENLVILPEYVEIVESFYSKEFGKKNLQKDSVDYGLSYIRYLDSTIINSKIKNEIIFNYSNSSMEHTKDLDQYFSAFLNSVSNKDYVNIITEKYNSMKLVSKGSISPDFELYDINNKLISLKSLKGNLVYIDIWATWCLPCLKEIPQLKILENELKDSKIKFVSICTFDTKDNWKKKVETEKLGGIQLFAPDMDIKFIKDYNVSGIPRFILIDKYGKIIDANAERPSSTALKEKLLKLM